MFYLELKGRRRTVRDSERVELQAGLRCWIARSGNEAILFLINVFSFIANLPPPPNLP